MASNSERRQQWAEDKLAPVLEPLVSDVLKTMPQDSKLYMSQWLANRKAGKLLTAGGGKEDTGEAEDRKSLAQRTTRKSFTVSDVSAPVTAATASAAPATIPSVELCPKFSWQTLCKDEAEERKRLCESMANLGYCVISASRSTSRAIQAVTNLTGRFFDKPQEEKKGLGNVRYSRGKLVGYLKREDGAQFLEVHGTSNGFVVPEPEGMKTFGPACGRLHEELLTIGREVLSWMADHIRVPREALLSCLDSPDLEELDKDEFGACVLRLCNYKLCASEDVFAEHTDASYLTVAPKSSAPGLQMWHAPTQAWLDVERGLEASDIVVFIGDFVEMFTKGFYKSALHRVVLRPEDAENRVSMPFLLRGQPSAEVHTAPFVDADPEISLKRVEHTPYEDLRLFLDLKGMKRMQNRTIAAETGEAPVPDSVLAPSGAGAVR